MLGDYDDSMPFWFADLELLTQVLHVEVAAIFQLFVRLPDLPKFFDAPEATIPQRTACFEVLAHSKVVETIEENFWGVYLDPPTLSKEESSTYKRSLALVRSDAPFWVLEMNEVADWLPARIQSALPEPLREGRYTNDPVKDEVIRSSARTLSTVEQIQSLTARVFNDQLQRLKERWSVTTGQTPERSLVTTGQRGGRKKTKHWLKGTKGLGPKKQDYSRYMDSLTEKQQQALSLRLEYRLGLAEVASRMGINRKTAYEHIEAASRKVDQVCSADKHRRNQSKTTQE